MRKHSLIFLLLFAFVFMMADAPLALFSGRESGNGVSQSDSVQDSSDLRGKEKNRKKKSRDKDDAKMLAKGLTENSDSLANAEPDTTQMDSLELAIYRHNKAIDDSIRLDSINKKKKNGIDSPVKYSAEDSLVYDATNKTVYLYGSSKVDYQIMQLQSDKIRMNLDSNVVHAVPSYADSTNTVLKGKPVFTKESTLTEEGFYVYTKALQGKKEYLLSYQKAPLTSKEIQKANQRIQMLTQKGYTEISRAELKMLETETLCSEETLREELGVYFLPIAKNYHRYFVLTSSPKDLKTVAYYYVMTARKKRNPKLEVPKNKTVDYHKYYNYTICLSDGNLTLPEDEQDADE